MTDLLLLLSRLEQERGPNYPVIALIDPHLPIEEIWSIDGTTGKAQFVNVRFFVYFRETDKMSEIRQMPAVPFSMTPPHSSWPGAAALRAFPRVRVLAESPLGGRYEVARDGSGRRFQGRSSCQVYRFCSECKGLMVKDKLRRR